MDTGGYGKSWISGFCSMGIKTWEDKYDFHSFDQYSCFFFFDSPLASTTYFVWPLEMRSLQSDKDDKSARLITGVMWNLLFASSSSYTMRRRIMAWVSCFVSPPVYRRSMQVRD